MNEQNLFQRAQASFVMGVCWQIFQTRHAVVMRSLGPVEPGAYERWAGRLRMIVEHGRAARRRAS